MRIRRYVGARLHSILLRLVLLLIGVLAYTSLQAQGIVTLTAADNGKETQLNIGDQLIIRLPTAQPRFGWRLAQAYPGQLSVTSSHTLPGLSSGVPGAPATHEIHLQAIGAGGFDLTFISATPGSGYSPLGNYFHTYVTINQPGVAKNVNISEYGNHGRVTVNQGDQLLIKLGTTVGSEYAWEAIPNDASIVKLVGQKKDEPKKNRKKPKPGSSEEVTYQFQALNPGQTTVRFIYRNTVNNEAPPSRDFELDVTVPQPPR
ncbi:protease inhibitor I42 family protein [Hymenobacter cellulosivorans]|uniref:Protease inhibitor I42 family protein n=1 Tax=Hymenobacter cellulosivorans TaxID=2932249 RepID=A0ABY4FEP9_9BACT|nr:protease inhibitor I42 family protein [Hymenobacter cellulosivorans]UOQ55020.1 protease inhibitor I42 family protein [Hymenobacter cellulosivorans]